MTQDEIDDLYREWEDGESGDHNPTEFYNMVERLIGPFVSLSANATHYRPIWEDFIRVIEEMGGTVLNDPNYHGMDQIVFMVWKDKKR